MMPALHAGKDVFVEWPLGASLAEAEEVTSLAKEKGVKTYVGLQARVQSAMLKVSTSFFQFPCFPSLSTPLWRLVQLSKYDRY